MGIRMCGSSEVLNVISRQSLVCVTRCLAQPVTVSSAARQKRTASRITNLRVMRPPQVALVVILAIAAVQIAYYYPQLPDVVASHFGISGAANSWEPKSTFFGLFGFIYALFAVLFWA